MVSTPFVGDGRPRVVRRPG